MNIKKYIEDLLLLQEENEAVIVEIYKTGSYLFKDNPKDLDYVVVCEGFTQRNSSHNVKVEGIVYDFFILDTKAVAVQQDFSDEFYIRTHNKLYAYKTQIRESIYGRYDNGWNMLDHEQEYKQFLKKSYDNTKVTKSKVTGYRNGKFYVHYYIVLKIYENGVAEITDEMIQEASKLYDKTKDSNSIKDWVIEQLNLIEVI